MRSLGVNRLCPGEFFWRLDMAAFGDHVMDDVFKALADPSRRMLLGSLNARTARRCASCAPGWTWLGSRSAST
jgi:hypothetical protein